MVEHLQKVLDNGGQRNLEKCSARGLKILQNNSRYIKAQDTKNFLWSVNIDELCKKDYPTDNRWDYLICVNIGKNKKIGIAFVEFHSATSGSHILDMIKKVHWLKTWAQTTGLGSPLCRMYWICPGPIKINKNTKEMRRLSKECPRLSKPMRVSPNLDQECYKKCLS